MSQPKTLRPKATARAARSARPRRRVARKSKPPVRRVAAKTALARTRHKKARPPGKLPEAYGTQKLLLVARDPRWLYAHWDFTREQLQRLVKRSATGRLVLRIFQEPPAGRLVAQADLTPESRHWFFPVGHAGTTYVAELGYQPTRGQWVSVAWSNTAVTPPGTITPPAPVAPPKPAMFATLPPDVPFPQMLEALGAAVAKDLPLVQAIFQFRAAGHKELPQISVGAGTKRWTRKQAHELARIAGAQYIRHRMARELASLAAAHIIAVVPPSSPGGGWSGDWH